MKLTRLAIPVVLVLLTAGILAAQRRPARPTPGGRRAAASETTEENGGLTFRLSAGREAAVPETDRPPVAPSRALSETEIRAVLDRLPPIKKDAGDERDFALREKSLPPPRTGTTIAGVFPPPVPADVPEVAAGPLTVLRRSPEGAVPLAPNLNVTFSKPMVAVTSHDELAAQDVPVKLAPQPAGRWRWVGTKTLLFEPEGRFPMATEYAAEVPAGTGSADGAALAAPVRWTFTTASPTVVVKHPIGGPSRRDVLLFAAFDQTIDPAAVLATIKVTAGGTTAPLRLATSDEVAADDDVRRLAEGAETGRWLAFRAAEPLPADAAVNITVGPGTPSAEGPRRTAKAQSWSFRTYGRLRVTRHRCGWNDDCRPLTPWQVEFSNPIDPKRFRKELLRIEPPVSQYKADVHGQSMTLRVASKGRTSYQVTLSPEIADVFGQTLGQSAPLTFKVGPAAQSLSAPGSDLSVLDPAGGPRFSVYTLNHARLKVRLYAVQPEHWGAYRTYLERSQRGEDATPPGRLVRNEEVATRGAPDELTETRLDLSPALAGGFGHVIVLVDPTVPPKERWQRQYAHRWVQSTQIGLTAFSDASELLAWASSLKDGSPLAGVEVELRPGGPSARTDGAGLARLPFGDTGAEILVARVGGDVALLPESTYWWRQDSSWRRRHTGDGLRWFVFDDRRLYRPGEEVKVKGWIRKVGLGEGGDVQALAGAVRRVYYALQDSQGNEVLKGDREIAGLGAFDLTLTLPSTMNLGHARLALTADRPGTGGPSHTHTLQVEEFRRPEFEVAASASEGPHFVRGGADVTVTASYYAGGALPNAAVAWNVSSSPGSFTPPNRSDFVFGIWVPWWEIHGHVPRHAAPARVETFGAVTDSAGRHRLRIDFERADPPRPANVRAEATVTDVNRQAWTSAANLLVHPAELYVGLRSERFFVQKGEPLRVDAIVTDLDGAAAIGRTFDVRAERLEWEQDAGEWKEKAVDPQDCALRSAAEPGRCTFATREGGTYRIRATVADERGRPNRTEIRMWVAGGQLPPRRDVAQEKVTLIPDKKEYAGGQTAEILVMAPFFPAEGTLTLRRSGIFRTERFTMTSSSHTLRIPLEEVWTPNVHVQVDLVGAAARTNDAGAADPKLPRRPAFAQGEINLEIPPHERTLHLKVAPREKAMEPGGSTTIDVAVSDAAGQSVAGSEVALVVVDEAVLSLTGYDIPDPISVFYAVREDGGSDYHSRQYVLLARPVELQAAEPEMALEEGKAMGLGAQTVALRSRVAGAAPPPPAAPAAFAMDSILQATPEPIQLRTDLRALALFVPGVTTDAAGRARVPLKLPDSLTRYRVTAVAVTEGNRFGKGESTVTARLPLMVRPSAPRFLNFGDEAELPVVLQNQTDAPLQVDVALRATNATLTGPAGRRVTVPANDRVEVRFAVAAAQAGTARFQVGAVSGTRADAAEISLPVWTPATTEAFATYGQIDEGAISQPVKAPAGVVPQFGGLEVTTSSTALQALTDAVLYLASYPFECAEQLSSRVMAVAALKDVLTAFQADGLPSRDEMVAAVDRDVKRLAMLQNGDGGFAFWRRGDQSWPYVSIHVAHALQRAGEKGFAVPAPTLEQSKAYLRDIEKHIGKEYGVDTRRTLIAYALYVRQRLGDRDTARARRLFQEAGLPGLSFEAIGWLLPVLSGDPGSQAEVAAIRRHLDNRATATAATAHFAVSYADGAHLILHSDRRADAVLLEALIGDQPKNDLIPKLVEGLLGHRKRGRWTNTQENAFVLLALDRYFATYEKVTPDFVARAWLGDAYAGEHAFRGRTTERHHVDIPMRYVAEGAASKNLVLSKTGPGRLYYRIGLQYAPASLTLAPADHGFTVERIYEGVDKKQDVVRDGDGTWRIRAGARVRVKLTMVAPSRRYHVALVDPLPAGLEPLNAALATTETLPPVDDETVGVIGASGLGGPGRPGHWWWWRRVWHDHQNLRDERVEAFAALLWEGVYSYTYVARATTPGRFVVPPPRAEEMYHPETFGRGGTDRVVVEAR